MLEHCFCGNNQHYFTCCRPYIEGGIPAPTPEALMRSRYTAYVKKDKNYLVSTCHPTTRTRHSSESILTTLKMWSGDR